MRYEGDMESTVNLDDHTNVIDAVFGDPHRRDVRALRIGDLAPAPESRRRAADRPAGETLRRRLRREHAELAEAILVLAGQLSRRERQLEHLGRYPVEDPFPEGTRLEFEKRFPDSDKRYVYLALKAGNRWHITGARSPQNVGWSKLVDFWGLGVDEVWKIGPRGGRKKVIG
jgi:hypothetical protein